MLNPKSLENLKAMPRLGSEPLASKPLCVKVPQSVDDAIRSLDSPSEWLRRVITDAAERELLPPAEPIATAKAEPARTSRRSANKKPAASAPKSKQEFKTGQLVKNPAGWRGWITKLLDDGKAVVDWEGKINGDVIPLHLLRACE